MRGLPYLNARIRDFTAKLGRRSGLRVVQWTRDAGRSTQNLEYNHRVYGTEQKCGSEWRDCKTLLKTPYLLECRDLRFYSKIGVRFGIESRGRGIRGAKNNHRAYGAEKNAGRDAGLNWGPLPWILTFLLNRSLCVLYGWFVGLFIFRSHR